MESGTELTELMCATCGRDTVQEAVYAGRLLTRITCTVCGTVVRFGSDHLKDEYLSDLRLRLRSKPARMLHRATKHPIVFARSLPRAILRQPGKLLREFRSAKGDDSK